MAEMTRRWMISNGGELAKSKSAKASEYIHHFRKYKKHLDFVLCYGRVSERPQLPHLKTYEFFLRKRCEKRGVRVCRYFGEQCSGKTVYFHTRDQLIAAIAEAKKLREQGKDVSILASSTNRYLRNINYSKTNQDVLPTKAELEELLALADGIPLLTVYPPDWSEREVRGILSKWGQRYKGNKGGRPKQTKPGYKKQLRNEKLEIVLLLYKENNSLGKIALLTRVPKSTVADWIRKYM
jgi:DNA invertase Pin-like site-specific DNA recombinase